MRIISGAYRGRRLFENRGSTTRPTTDRVKENIFNVLSNYVDFDGVTALDLFAGTGQYGIESLSRGAKTVHFNDLDRGAADVIKKNLAGMPRNYTISNLNYKDVLGRARPQDLIFIDPPYDTDFGADAIGIILNKNLLTENGIIVFETDKDFTHPNVFLHKKYGRADVYFLNH